MAQKTGSFSIADLQAVRYQSVKAYGIERVAEILRADIAAHNRIVTDMMREIAEVTTDAQRRYGASTTGDMIKVDEYGRAPTQKSTGGGTVAFPLEMYQFAVGWTEKYLDMATPADIAEKTLMAEKAHMRALRRAIQTALFLSTNYTFNDYLVDKVDLAVKRLINADSSPIPDGPNGETFDGASHTHYDGFLWSGGDAGTRGAALIALANDVMEHGHTAGLRLIINRADETDVRAVTGFVPYVDPRVIYRASDTPGQTLDITKMDDRAIGIIGPAEVWVKPWGIDNYILATAIGDSQKPIAFRQRSQETLQGLRIAATFDSFPLHAQHMETEFGMGVYARTNGAVLYTGSATWADPTIPA